MCGQARACLKRCIRPDTFISLLCSCICFVRGSLFSFIHLFGNLDMEYRLQRSNLLIDEDVGGRTREDGAAGGFQR